MTQSLKYQHRFFVLIAVVFTAISLADHASLPSPNPTAFSVSSKELNNHPPIKSDALNFNLTLNLQKDNTTQSQQYTARHVMYHFDCEQGHILLQEEVRLIAKGKPVDMPQALENENISQSIPTSASCTLLSETDVLKSQVASVETTPYQRHALTLSLRNDDNKTQVMSQGAILTPPLEQLLLTNLPKFNQNRDQAAANLINEYNTNQKTLSKWADTRKLAFDHGNLSQ